MTASVSRATMAGFLKLGIAWGLLTRNDVVAWADQIIMSDDEPPYWAISISLQDDEHQDHLWSVAANADLQFVSLCVVGFLQRLRFLDTISDMQLSWILHYLAEHFPATGSQRDQLYQIAYDHLDWDKRRNLDNMFTAFLKTTPDYSMELRFLPATP